MSALKRYYYCEFRNHFSIGLTGSKTSLSRTIDPAAATYAMGGPVISEFTAATLLSACQDIISNVGTGVQAVTQYNPLLPGMVITNETGDKLLSHVNEAIYVQLVVGCNFDADFFNPAGVFQIFGILPRIKGNCRVSL